MLSTAILTLHFEQLHLRLDNNELTVRQADLETTMSANLAIDSPVKEVLPLPAKLQWRS
jgi:hypothetical protein